jgi:hypothetical protein
MKKLHVNELILILNNNILGTLENDKYISWNKLEIEDERNMDFIGELYAEGKIVETEYPTKLNYWDKDYPIHPLFYPNFNGKVYKNRLNDRYYLIYLEFGGHAPEKRCRLIRKYIIQ